jgi:hypothetical protein
MSKRDAPHFGFCILRFEIKIRHMFVMENPSFVITVVADSPHDWGVSIWFLHTQNMKISTKTVVNSKTF